MPVAALHDVPSSPSRQQSRSGGHEETDPTTQKITRKELLKLLDGPDRPILVEALPERYFLDRHLPGAINMSHDRVDELAPTLLPDRTAPVVVYCANAPCRNSGLAAHRLTDLGYTRVFDYHEGKQDWIEAGLPVERGTAAAA